MLWSKLTTGVPRKCGRHNCSMNKEKAMLQRLFYERPSCDLPRITLYCDTQPHDFGVKLPVESETFGRAHVTFHCRVTPVLQNLSSFTFLVLSCTGIPSMRHPTLLTSCSLSRLTHAIPGTSPRNSSFKFLTLSFRFSCFEARAR